MIILTELLHWNHKRTRKREFWEQKKWIFWRKLWLAIPVLTFTEKLAFDKQQPHEPAFDENYILGIDIITVIKITDKIDIGRMSV